VPIAISAEQRALQASIRDWAERAGTLALVRGLEPGAPPSAPGTPPIAGGTSQILLSVIAERGLGLPREEAR
jgi:hypothetical protein